MNSFTVYGAIALLLIGIFSACSSKSIFGDVQSGDIPQCPPQSSYPVFFPHPTQCDLYYMCSNGYPYLMNCAITLWWSQDDSTCLPAGTVVCSTRPPSTTTTTTTTTTTEAPSTTQVTTEPPSTTEAEQPEPTTSKVETQQPTTVQSEPSTTTAPQTTDAEIRTEEPATTSPPENPTTIVTTANPITQPPTTTERDRFPCPPDPFIYLPHDQFCNLFYLCRYGTFRGTFNCGPSEWFDSRSQQCVPPQNSDCTLEPLP